jgi:hypothetical protein
MDRVENGEGDSPRAKQQPKFSGLDRMSHYEFRRQIALAWLLSEDKTSSKNKQTRTVSDMFFNKSFSRLQHQQEKTLLQLMSLG